MEPGSGSELDELARPYPLKGNLGRILFDNIENLFSK
jgi:hypothetical protein